MGHGRSVRQLSAALPPRVQVLGVGVDPVSADELLPRVSSLIDKGDEATVTYANVHVLNQARKDPNLTDFLAQADLVYCDGSSDYLTMQINSNVGLTLNLSPLNAHFYCFRVGNHIADFEGPF